MEFPFRTVSGAELAALLASACAQTANSSASSHPPLFLLDCRHASLHARSHVRGALSAPSFDALSDRAFVMARLPRPQRADALKSFTLEACALPATTLAAVRVVMAGQSGSGSSGSAPGAADSAEGLLATATSAGADCCRVCVYDSGSMKVENASAALPLLFALHAAGVANIGFLSGGFGMFSFRYPDFISNESIASFGSRPADSDNRGDGVSALNSAFAHLGIAAKSAPLSSATSSSCSSSSSSSAPAVMSTADMQLLQLLCPISQRASLRQLLARRHASLSAPSSSSRSNMNSDAHRAIGTGNDAVDDDDDDDVEWAEKQCARGPSELIPGALYLGSAADAHNANVMAALGISAVVNAAAEMASIPSEPPSPLYPLGRTSVSIPLRDESTFPIAAHFAAFATQMDACFAQRRTALVHCRAGNSRAAALVIAYVMMRTNLVTPISVDGSLSDGPDSSASGVSADAKDSDHRPSRLPTSLRDALVFVKSRRPTVSLNEGFVHALLALEASLLAAHHAPATSAPSSLSSLTDHAIVSQPPSPSISPALVRVAHAGGGAVLTAALSASPPLRETLAALAPVAAAAASRFEACVRSLQSGLFAASDMSVSAVVSALPLPLTIAESSALSGFAGHSGGSDFAHRDRGTLVISDASSALPSGFETRARAPVLGVGMSTFCHGSVDADDSDEWDGDGGSEEDEDEDEDEEDDEEEEEDDDDEKEDARRSALYAGRSDKKRAEGEGERGSDNDDEDDDNLERYARGDDSDADSFEDEENDNDDDPNGRAYGDYPQQHAGSLGFASHRRPELLSAAAAPASTSALPPFAESDYSEQALTARLQQRLAAASSSSDFATLSLRRSGDASSSSSAAHGPSSSPSSLSSLLASAASVASAAGVASPPASAGLRSARPAVAAALAAARAQNAATAAPFVNPSESMGSMPPAPVRDVVTLPKLYGSRQ